MSKREKQTIKLADVGSLDEVIGTTPKHKDGDCIDCKGPCKGHSRDFCDVRDPSVKCTHAPGSRECDLTTLHDSDETSPQALAAKKQGTRKYASK